MSAAVPLAFSLLSLACFFVLAWDLSRQREPELHLCPGCQAPLYVRPQWPVVCPECKRIVCWL